MKILKVKFLNDRASIKYEQEVANGKTANRSIDEPERPAEPFFEALEGLQPHWTKSLELTKGGKLEVYGATLSYHGDANAITAILHGKRHLQKSEFNHPINSPKMVEHVEGAEAPEGAMSEECLAAVKALIEAAEKYVDGERLEVPMPLEEATG